MANVTDDAWTSVLNVFGDVVYIDIQNVISLENTYCFNINLDSPGPKRIVFRIRQQVPANTDATDSNSDTESEMDSDATEIETEDIAEEDGTDDMEMPEFETEEGGNDDAEMTLTEDMEVGVGEPGVNVEDEGLAIGEDYQPVVASPCKLLTRRVGNPNEDPENPTAPWSYYVKKFIPQGPDASL
ncbi:hypothetical protein BD769DRAFT_1668104 [Suillus cothurnatus]|nr:hypothetical protein BD769DRAFT_1668104 [Suillus cothurnatus]